MEKRPAWGREAEGTVAVSQVGWGGMIRRLAQNPLGLPQGEHGEISIVGLVWETPKWPVIHILRVWHLTIFKTLFPVLTPDRSAVRRERLC